MFYDCLWISASLNLCSGSACSTVNGFCLKGKEPMSMIPFWGLYCNNLHMFTRRAVVPIGLVQVIKFNPASAKMNNKFINPVNGSNPIPNYKFPIPLFPIWKSSRRLKQISTLAGFRSCAWKVLHCKNHTYNKYVEGLPLYKGNFFSVAMCFSWGL